MKMKTLVSFFFFLKNIWSISVLEDFGTSQLNRVPVAITAQLYSSLCVPVLTVYSTFHSALKR